jgi:hypothetical protein
MCLLTPLSIMRTNSAIFATCCFRTKPNMQQVGEVQLNNLLHYNRAGLGQAHERIGLDNKITIQLQTFPLYRIY